ncbi:MAG: hypothetical protein CL885_02715 [Dehalococcoidia bacterium]|nr:hypothetical protein [Dehalococcoidia bacterium]
MSKKLIFKCPINGLSFGNVGVNILYQLYLKDIDTCIIPHGQQADLSTFDKLPTDFKKWVEASISQRFKKIKKETPCLNLWHINGCENKTSDRNVLYTFYETTQPTEEEVNLVNLYDETCFSSTHALNVFKESGASRVNSIPLGIDPSFKKETHARPEKIHFGLVGKWEKRKHTAKIIQAWAKQYGNNHNYELSCLVNNKFLSNEQVLSEKARALRGETYGNINFLPWLPLNSQVNALMNSIDIDLSGMSGAEGWNLPAFNATALGKWSIVLNATSHKDWATKENSVLVEPNGKESIVDEIFFQKDFAFNQGEKYTFAEDDLIEAMSHAEKLCLEENEEGKKLKDKFNYSNTTDQILDVCCA